MRVQWWSVNDVMSDSAVLLYLSVIKSECVTNC
jgi:hypothetical protein